MTHEEFFQALKTGKVANLYLFDGEEEYIKDKALQALRAKLLPEGLEELNENILINPTEESLVFACETLPFMAERRLVVVRDCSLISASGKKGDKKGDKEDGKTGSSGESDGSEAIAEYLKRLPPHVCLLFYCRGKADERRKLPARMAKVKGYAHVVFSPLDGKDLVRWITVQAKREGKEISEADAGYLAFVSGHDLTALTREMAKLAAYAGEAAAITRADIDAAATRTAESSVFELVEDAAAGREEAAYRQLKRLMEQGESPVAVLSLLTRQFRLLTYWWLLKGQGLADWEIMNRLKLWRDSYGKLKEQAKRIDAGKARAFLDLCVESDLAFKSGILPVETALDRVLLRICS